MFYGSIPHDRIIDAFQKHVPGCYVRDYRDNGGYITLCRNFKNIRWKNQLHAGHEYRQVPVTTLCSLPRGNVTSATMFDQVRLVRPGWRIEFRKAMRTLTYLQQKAITKTLGVGEVFAGVV